MKAVDYFKKFKNEVLTDDGLKKLLLEMSEEVTTIAYNRKAVCDDAIEAIISEMNQRWNALCRLFEKEYKQPILKRNGFLEFWKTRLKNTQ